MFLLDVIIVITAVYIISALVSEIILNSKTERKLPPLIKIGFSFLLIIAYFSSAWLIMSAQQAWLLGILLLVCYAFGQVGFSFKKMRKINFTSVMIPYISTFGWVLIGSLLFFIPLLLSNNYGPFTEGGGDITIYSDTAKFTWEHHLSILGSDPKSLTHIFENIKSALFPSAGYGMYYDSAPIFDKNLINPPAAENATYRIMINQGMNSFFYVPYAVFAFLGQETNYPVYFGIQAFLYVCMLGGIWYFFKQFSSRLAFIAITLVGCSHGLISVFYNMYSMQANSLAISALILAILPTIRFFSWAGFRTYGSALLLIWLIYIHYLSVILPLLVCATLFSHYPKEAIAEHKKSYFTFLTKSIASIFLFLWLFVAWIGSSKSLLFAKALLSGAFFKRAHEFLGDGLSFFSLEWLSFLFGLLSQQHFYPFAQEYYFVNWILLVGICTGWVILISGGLFFISLYYFPKQKIDNIRLYSVIYIIALLTVIVQIYLGFSSLYTQAKGAQNVQLYFYVVMLMPYALGIVALKQRIKIYKFVQVLSVLILTIFISCLFMTKLIYTGKLAFGHDRNSIMEASYFSAAKQIRKQDANAFVLFEPRKSTDLYLSTQAFFGMKMVPTRHLILKKVGIRSEYTLGTPNLLIYLWTAKVTSVPEMIDFNNWSHLWTLTANCTQKWGWLAASNCKWTAERLIEKKNPTLLLFSDNYERNFGEREILSKSKQLAMFSFVGNGAAVLYLPAGNGKVEVTMEPRDITNYAQMVKEVKARLKNGEFGKQVKMTADGKFIKLIYDFNSKDTAQLKLIANYKGEYWLNAKLNQRDIS